MNYEWDPEKATSNLRKHGISFEDATVVFEDTYALEDYDTDHSMSAEKRFTRLGLGKNGILYIVYTLRANYPEIIRIISARRATTSEEAIYLEQSYGK